ncbi:lipocalin family protein [Pedobacter caeni]|uniref:Lipocalin-like domain-containing protein n=1 Tax=Pedobacter caeni TaxID=288992 RepID=A0A1M4VGX4_9SPHI|nr:lipocalin family protein [Pedobacter caeni]SHE68188.1 hypothetical protein SAMN04488522_101904 [Pedobacter caeni]
MKSKSAILLLLTLLLSVTACKKDRDKEPEKTVNEKVIGRWNLTSFIEIIQKPGEPPKTNTSEFKGGYFEFFADGTMKTNIEGELTATYKIKNDTTIELFDEPYTIKEITNNKFVFEASYTSSTRTVTSTFTLGR